MSQSSLWWILAGCLVGLELLSGTFYLLMLALGAGAGALLAHAGFPLTAQIVAAAVVGGGAVTSWYLRMRGRGTTATTASANPDALDIGQTVHVSHWSAERTAHVRYRGTEWQARFQGDGHPESGSYRIAAVDANQLILEKV
ncbi:NfeD family protein [Aquabacterium sp.]|uniref:NfeD family protein n=1 Tax=Aquabacterium sp. TaxID=1872578 RepID=UPI0035AE129D